MLRAALLLLVCSAAPATSQGAPPAPQSNMGYARQAWREVRTNLLQAATEAPESLFTFRPTPEVRSFGETLDHIAASEHGYCRMALGERPLGGGAGTGATTKPAILAALEASREVCDRAYAQGDSVAALPAYGSRRATRLHILLTNAMHDSEHYGNVVTYLRVNGIVPPSSRPAVP